MQIENCTPHDTDDILALYAHARRLQTERNMVVWPDFSREFIEAEIAEQRQWKLVINDTLACNWAIAYSDPDIWEEKEKGDAIYVHRIATHPEFRGQNFVKALVPWFAAHAQQRGRQWVRLDTLGDNTRLIALYTDAGFTYLGQVQLRNTDNLPGHYQQGLPCCLFEMKI